MLAKYSKPTRFGNAGALIPDLNHHLDLNLNPTTAMITIKSKIKRKIKNRMPHADSHS
jgi:hypothetical protein